MIEYKYHDGGRKAAGYQGTAGDCVVRSIAITTGLPYQKVYDLLNAYIKANECKRSTARNGVTKKIVKQFLLDLGFEWVPVMKVGSGCKMHVTLSEVPGGIVILSLSKHVTACINKVIYDTYDPSRQGTRCVYGYYRRPEKLNLLTINDTISL